MKIRSVADVRRLHACEYCKEVGMHGEDLLLISYTADSRGRKRNKAFAHARCLTTAVLLSLPAEELGNVRMCDVTPEVLQLILAKLQPKRMCGIKGCRRRAVYHVYNPSGEGGMDMCKDDGLAAAGRGASLQLIPGVK